MTRASAAASTPLSTITRRPPVSTISIRPDASTGHDEDGEFSGGLNTFRERRPTAGRRLAADHCLRKHRAIVDLDKTPLSGQTAPREQLARRQSIPPRRRRYLPPPIVALAHDPALLFQRPTTPGTSLDHLKSRHLRHSRMISHTPMSSPPHPSHKAVLSAGIRFSLHESSEFDGRAAAAVRSAEEPCRVHSTCTMCPH